MNKHLAAILAGTVTRSNVIGIRKAINAAERRERGYSVSRTAPRLGGRELAAVEQALTEHEPRVIGELHDSGLKLLQSPRYRKRLESVAEIVANLESFHLVSFDRTQLDGHGANAVPVYRARGAGRSFLFRNIAWQSGGNGPEILPQGEWPSWR